MLGDKIRKLRETYRTAKRISRSSLCFTSGCFTLELRCRTIVTTLRSMAQIFNISLDKLLSHEVIEEDSP